MARKTYRDDAERWGLWSQMTLGERTLVIVWSWAWVRWRRLTRR